MTGVHLDRRQILKGMGMLAGIAASTMPRSSYSLSRIPVDLLQQTLGQLGYMQPDWITGAPNEFTDRAVVRFKRHASRPYRISPVGKPEDVASASDRFTGDCEDPAITEQTAQELSRWVTRGWRLPLGRFKFDSLAESGRPASNSLKWSLLREDAAKAWRAVMREVDQRGATISEPYGDTRRPLGHDRKEGVSRTSVHICGRAVDLNQNLTLIRGQRYFLSPEEAEGRMYFRLYCLTSRQNGSQGVLLQDRQVKQWRSGLKGELFIPRGWYVDVTKLFDAAKFERIAAHAVWEKYDIYSEWWHYQYNVDLQDTFLDECELVGISEKELLTAKYTIEEMDREPG